MEILTDKQIKARAYYAKNAEAIKAKTQCRAVQNKRRWQLWKRQAVMNSRQRRKVAAEQHNKALVQAKNAKPPKQRKRSSTLGMMIAMCAALSGEKR